MKINKSLALIKYLLLGSLLMPALGHANSCQDQLSRSATQLNRCQQRLTGYQTSGDRLFDRLSELNRSLDNGNSYTLRDCRREVRSLGRQEESINNEMVHVTQRNQKLRNKKKHLQSQVAFECIGVEGKHLKDSVRAVAPTKQLAINKVKKLARSHASRKMFRKSTVIGCFAIPKKGGNRDHRELNVNNGENDDLGVSRRRRRHSTRG